MEKQEKAHGVQLAQGKTGATENRKSQGAGYMLTKEGEEEERKKHPIQCVKTMKKRPEEMSPKGRRGAEQLIRYHQTHKKERALHTAQLQTPEVRERALAGRRFRAEIKEHIEGIFDKYKDMSYGEMKERLKKMEANPKKYKFSDYQVLQYMLNKKNTIDFFDRFIGKAPNLVDLKTEAQGSVIVVQDTVFEGGGVYTETGGGYVQNGTPNQTENKEVIEGEKESNQSPTQPTQTIKRKRGRPRKSETSKEDK